jgi:hypothetical protein
MGDATRTPGKGPFRADQLSDGDRYELSSGHAVYCAPSGARHGGANAVGALVPGTDPKVTEVGIDVGYAMAPDELRAPDVSVGNVPNEPGWVEGAPPLALEYADRGTNEGDLQDKVRSLLDAGTRWVWVVRLTGARIVQVFERDKLVRVAKEGELLEAPGVLANPVPVAALFDREAALDASVRNLLQRKGIPALDEALARSRDEGRAMGREEGREEGLRAAIEDLCELLSIELTAERREWLATQNAAALDTLRAALKRDRRWP